MKRVRSGARKGEAMDEGLTASLGELAHMDAEHLAGLQADVGLPIPSRPLLGRLPLRRVVPQDVHSVMDYAGGLALLLAGAAAKSSVGKSTGFALGAAMIGTSLFTDYRLSLAKLVPIEAHEMGDYAIGAAAIVAPLSFAASGGRVSRWLQLAVGATTILASLFTDYRAVRGVGRR